MKYVTIVFLCVTLSVACKKSAITNPSQSLIVGKWRIINDSSFITGSLNGVNGGSNYVGTPSDYFTFTSNGNLYIREGQSLDTATYTISSNNQQINILYSYIAGSYISGDVAQSLGISNYTENHLTLTMPGNGLIPEGYLHRIINLRK